MLNNEKNRNVKEKPLLLFSPLDWGFGHLTRSIPIIKAFQEKGWHIAVACNSTQKNIILSEIYGVTFYDLPGYNIRYSSGGWLTKARIVAQFGKILMKIKEEKQWLSRFLDGHEVQLVISDNRYGFCDPRVHCILITHQLAPRSGLGNFFDHLFQKAIYSLINQFARCWVPDTALPPGLAGDLSHPPKLPAIPTDYIGPLSRLEMTKKINVAEKYELLIILSGPEPQRSILEEKLLAQLELMPDLKCALVRGMPKKALRNIPKQVDAFEHLDSIRLSSLAASSDYVLCRSGYTSLMDMVKLKKRMILVPTPGQTEQEYLARHFMKHQYAFACQQQKLVLTDILNAARNFEYRFYNGNMNEYENFVTASIHE